MVIGRNFLLADRYCTLVVWEIFDASKYVLKSVSAHSDVGIGLMFAALQKWRYLFQPTKYA